jgi:hypothetical protein
LGLFFNQKEFKLTKATKQNSVTDNSETVFWGGVATAVGSLGVVVTSAFYALSPVPAALPIPNPVMATALAGMIAGRNTMVAAGTVGIGFDVIMIAGALLLMAFRKPASLQIERLGWALVAISVLIFIGVDSLAAGVLTQLAVMDGALGAFAGFKLIFDMLFILGTLAFGLGVPAILVSEMRAERPVLATPLIWVGLIAAAMGLVAGLLYFVNVSLPQVIGISIALGAIAFTIYGVQIARARR